MAVEAGSVGPLERPDGARAAPGPPPASPAQDVPMGPDAGIMTVMATTRAMRHLAPDPVPYELLRTVIEAATWAPSGENKQVARYVVVTNRGVMARLAPLWRRVIEDYRLMLEAGGVTAGSDPTTLRIRASVEYQRDHFAEIPALIVVCGEPGGFGETRGSTGALAFLMRRVGLRRALGLARAITRFGRSEAGFFYPAVENLLLAARAHGLAACLTTLHLFREDEFKAVIGIPKEVQTWAIIPIGWPLRRFGPVNRRPVDEVIHRERW
jgi:nitroreductase